MNQFRDIMIGLLLILAASLGFGRPEDWTWEERLGTHFGVHFGSQAVLVVRELTDLRPWSIILCCVLALALFMTRLKY